MNVTARLEALKVAELRKLAAQARIAGRSSMRKAELVAALADRPSTETHFGIQDITPEQEERFATQTAEAEAAAQLRATGESLASPAGDLAEGDRILLAGREWRVTAIAEDCYSPDLVAGMLRDEADRGQRFRWPRDLMISRPTDLIKRYSSWEELEAAEAEARQAALAAARPIALEEFRLSYDGSDEELIRWARNVINPADLEGLTGPEAEAVRLIVGATDEELFGA